MKVTNNSKSVQGVHTLHGVRYIQPGGSRDLVLTLNQALRADRLPFIDLDGDPVEDPAPSLSVSAEGKEGVYIPASEFNGLRDSFEQLRTENASLRQRIAELEGNGSEQTKTIDEVLVLADDGTHFKTFEAEAKKILGDATPATKDEIVAALKAKQTA
ncbi:hypothetical protein G6M87_09200 [Rhizobium rhizogenes]|uniref:hypothetical protein n=1 Tax=Rhizobium rhizogenes TaxID=359 RepID=UPI001571F501|nr:hypothetical protein [Rhizobium rhizogenes]NTI22038.1 hypothetical protein [Rhizobium rhizogenes]QTG05643.1 hypothetical protein G6M87_09200 [Rhizobium rhizogenes]